MKKIFYPILIAVCFTQCISSPDTKKVSKNPNTEQNVTTTNEDKKAVSEINTSTDDSEIQIKEDNTIYNIDSIDVKPDFPGGIKKLQKFLRQNTKYPKEELQVKGTVDVNFIVEKDGKLSDIKFTKDEGYGTGKEAIRVLTKCPKWIPGIHNQAPVRVRYNLTIPIDVYHDE